MADNKPPPGPSLRLVPEVDQDTRDRLEAEAKAAHEKRDQLFAEDEVRHRLRSLAANVLRIVRGAGKPYMVARDAAEVLKAFDEYREAFGHWPPSYDIGEMLRVDINQGSLDDRNWALELVTRGGLQLAASTLLAQRPQISAGEHELLEGVRLWNKYTADAHAKRARKSSSLKQRKQKPEL